VIDTKEEAEVIDAKEVETPKEDILKNKELLYACHYGDYDRVDELLFENIANINYQDKQGYTPLMNALEEGHLSIVALLLNKNVNIKLKNKAGETARVIAHRCNHKSIYKYFW